MSQKTPSDRKMNLAALSAILLPALAVTLGVQILRVYLPGVLLVVGDRLTVEQMGLFALATFLAGFLAPVGVRLFKPGGFLHLTVGGLALIRLATQLVNDPWWYVAFSTVGIVLWLWFFAAYVAWLRSSRTDLRYVGLGLFLGITVETAFKGIAWTYDLIWRSGIAAGSIVFLLGAALIWSLVSQTGRTAGQQAASDTDHLASRAWPLLAVGPYLFLELLIFRNFGRAQVMSGLDLPSAFNWIHLSGTLLPVLLWLPIRGKIDSRRSKGAGAARTNTSRTGAVSIVLSLLAAVVLVAALWILGPGAPTPDVQSSGPGASVLPAATLWLLLGHLSAAWLLLQSLGAADESGAGIRAGAKRSAVRAGAVATGSADGVHAGTRRLGTGRDSLALGLGFLIMVGCIFFFYSEYAQQPEVFVAAGAVLAIIGLAATFLVQPASQGQSVSKGRSVAHRSAAGEPSASRLSSTSVGITNVASTALLLSLCFALLPIWTVFSHQPAKPVLAAPQTRQLRLMTYNIQMGFNVTSALDLAAQARTIAAAAPDVIALQEASRGWTVSSSADTVAWLARELGMTYVWVPFSGDLWGQAVLSRYPIIDVVSLPFPDNAGDVGEGLLAVTILVDGDPVHVISSHFSAAIGGRGGSRSASVRLQQAQLALDLWGARPRTVLMGDLNFTPDAAEYSLLTGDQDADRGDVGNDIADLRNADFGNGFIDALAILGPDAFTSKSDNPKKRIDHVLLSPDLEVLEAAIPPSTASDHRPVVVTIGW